MYDVDKDLNEIRSITVSPSITLIKITKEKIMQEEDELSTKRRKTRRIHTVRVSRYLTIPATAAAVFIIFIRMAIPTPVSYYSIDINPNISIAVDESGNVCKVENADLDINNNEIIGKSVEYAVSQIIIHAQENGYIKDNENLLIGGFGDDEHNNISKNKVLSYLESDLRDDIILLSINGSIDDWKAAKKDNYSAGLYTLSLLSNGIKITQATTLDELILLVQNSQNIDIHTYLAENSEPIIYKAPKLTYYLDEKYAIINWDFIDFNKYNYDGYITYQLISADTENGLLISPTIVDEFTFESWDVQPTEYTLQIDDEIKDKYYAIVANYDDGNRFINDSYIVITESN